MGTTYGPKLGSKKTVLRMCVARDAGGALTVATSMRPGGPLSSLAWFDIPEPPQARFIVINDDREARKRRKHHRRHSPHKPPVVRERHSHQNRGRRCHGIPTKDLRGGLHCG